MRGYIANTNPLARYAIADGATIVEDDIVALNAAGEAVAATDAAAVKVKGIAVRVTDTEVEVRDNIYQIANSTAHPLARTARGAVAYVENKNTVNATGGTHKVVAGLLVDVDDGSAYVDMRPHALAAAQALANQAADVAALVTSTYVAPTGGTAIDTEGRAALAKLAVDTAAVIAALKAAGLMATA